MPRAARRYLLSSEVGAALRRGRSVEQIVSVRRDGGQRVIGWVWIAPRRGGYTVGHAEVLDAGSDDFLDLIEFPLVGDAEHLERFIAVDDALAHAAAFGAASDRWGPEGVLSDEYADLRAGRHRFLR